MSKKKSSKISVLMPQEGELNIALFKKNEIRRRFHQNEWWFSIMDIIESLVETNEPSSYWAKMKLKEKQLGRKWTKLKMKSKDGKLRDTECGNIEDILRIIQSIPSKKAEPFKKWLAKTGFERIKEKQNPELAIRRAMLEYEMQGRNKKWISDRIQGIVARNKLTYEWRERGVEGKQYGILTNIIHKGTFGISVKEHKDVKKLKEHNLRNNMSNVELIFQRLGDEATLEITKERNANGFNENYKASKDGGESAGDARNAFEKRMGKKVITSENFLKNINNNELLDFDENKLKEIALIKPKKK